MLPQAIATTVDILSAEVLRAFAAGAVAKRGGQPRPRASPVRLGKGLGRSRKAGT